MPFRLFFSLPSRNRLQTIKTQQIVHKKYTSIEDFMMDLDFREWVLHPTPEADQFWNAWIKSNPDRVEELNAARALVSKLAFAEESVTEESYNKVLQRTLAGQKSKYADSAPVMRTIGLQWIGRVAAVLILGVFMYLFYTANHTPKTTPVAHRQTVVKENSSGRKSQIYLPDGTTVWLNADSKIEYAPHFTQDMRQVTLIGEAYFAVAKDKARPFVVQTSAVAVTAIGTEFNVKAYAHHANHHVALAEGKVMVKSIHKTSGQPEKHYLDPGQAIIASTTDAKLIQTSFSHKEALGWKEGIIYFENASLLEVVERLERWYGKRFVIKNAKKAGEWSFDSEFHNETLENVMRTISYSKDFEYQIQEDTVTIIF